MLKWGLILLVFITCISEAQERRFVLWNKNGVAIEPWEKITIDVAEKIHYSPDKNSIELKYGELSVWHEAKNWMKYGAGLRVSYANLQNGKWLNENRPMVYLNFLKDLNSFDLSFSNRFEYRTFEKIDNFFRYKQALKLNFPSLTSWGMQFYLSEESYYKMNGGGTHAARFYSGVKALDKKRFAMNLYYSLEKSRVSDIWLTTDIVGLNLSFSI